ncbi:MAG: transporter substrate-binding domain-containing protein [Clostridia bacterium]|nr:transporter substrate-binding domain-containing protein [Clostridia bacterium]
MKKTIKLIALVMALVFVVTAFSACGGTKDETNKDAKLAILDTEYITEDYAIAVGKENAQLLTDINNALIALKNDGTVKKIQDKYILGTEHDLVFQQNVEGKEEIKMGTNAEFPPYEFKEGDAIVGIDAEIAAAIADKLGKKLVIEDMAFDGLIPALEAGRIQFIMAGLTVTEERKQSVNFTESYATGVQVVIVKEGSAITSADDLFAPKADGSLWKVGVQQGTTGDLYTTWDLAEPEEGEPTATIERYSKGADAVQALITGKVDCVVIDNEPAKEFVKVNNK